MEDAVTMLEREPAAEPGEEPSPTVPEEAVAANPKQALWYGVSA
jgi:hypothetical protein